MIREIHYLLSHPPHSAYLVVSLKSLRDWWDGKVIVHGWPHTGAWDVVQMIGADSRLGIEVQERVPKYTGERDHLLDKIAIMSEIYGVDSAMLLDADTIIVGGITEIFEAAEQFGFCVTQYCNWTTTLGIIKNRVKRLLPFTALDRTLILDSLEHPFPSSNVGIFATTPGSPVMPVWYEWSYVGRSVYIPDECAMQCLLPHFQRQGIATILDGRWNCSTMRFQHIPDHEVRIWHGHGNSFLRPRKSPKGFRIWWPRYVEALQLNLGGIRDWPRKYESKHMRKLREEGELPDVEVCEA